MWWVEVRGKSPGPATFTRPLNRMNVAAAVKPRTNRRLTCLVVAREGEDGRRRIPGASKGMNLRRRMPAATSGGSRGHTAALEGSREVAVSDDMHTAHEPSRGMFMENASVFASLRPRRGWAVFERN